MSSLMMVAQGVAAMLCLLSGTFGIWIDIDTPPDKFTTTSLIDGTEYNLVMSDEFNAENRTFDDGHDATWTAMDKPDDDYSAQGTGSQQFYNSTMVTTENGRLKISTAIGKTKWVRYDKYKKKYVKEERFFKSGMVQSWNKFCFTGGIVEIDVILPGLPYVGGLWPAIWMMGNLGRATYEGSTNRMWPWSYNECNRDLQPAQDISACNRQNHFGLPPYVGRGATEIDIVEVMAGPKEGPLPETNPPIEYPYTDFTLQVSPGVWRNRPQAGHQPLRNNTVAGHTEYLKQTWYEGMEIRGNTSHNPFFYGRFLGETKKWEPVMRSKRQAYQADAIGSIHQLTPSHFDTMHTFRLEWQPGPGGRLDWFVKGHKTPNTTYPIEGDGLGQDWVKAYTIKDESLRSLTGAQIPIEPSYLILNTAVAPSWGFPYDAPGWCPKCFDCDSQDCGCAFYPGFCDMLRGKGTAMWIDHVRVYQSPNASAHVGANHTVGCDNADYPTREWIYGHTDRYMRQKPFSYYDFGPIRNVKRGWGTCQVDADCGANDSYIPAWLNASNNATLEMAKAWLRDDEHYGDEKDDKYEDHAGRRPKKSEKKTLPIGRGVCDRVVLKHRYCRCHEGFTGPNCKSLAHEDDFPGVMVLKYNVTLMENFAAPHVPPLFGTFVVTMMAGFASALVWFTIQRKKERSPDVSALGGDSSAGATSYQQLPTGRLT